LDITFHTSFPTFPSAPQVVSRLHIEAGGGNKVRHGGGGHIPLPRGRVSGWALALRAVRGVDRKDISTCFQFNLQTALLLANWSYSSPFDIVTAVLVGPKKYPPVAGSTMSSARGGHGTFRIG
jgi:hypothetical protein